MEGTKHGMVTRDKRSGDVKEKKKKKKRKRKKKKRGRKNNPQEL